MKNIEFIELCTKAISKYILPNKIALVKEELFKIVSDKEIRSIEEFKPKDNESALNLFISSNVISGCSYNIHKPMLLLARMELWLMTYSYKT